MTSGDDIRTALAQAEGWLRTMREERQRRPLAPVVRAAEDLTRQHRRAALAVASNLLQQALRAIGTGHDDEALRLVERALRVEGVRDEVPAGDAVHDLLVAELVEAAGTSARADSRWLQHAMRVAEEAEDTVAEEVWRALGAVADDLLTVAEQQRLQEASSVGSWTEPLDHVPAEDRAPVLLGVLRALEQLRGVPALA